MDFAAYDSIGLAYSRSFVLPAGKRRVGNVRPLASFLAFARHGVVVPVRVLRLPRHLCRLSISARILAMASTAHSSSILGVDANVLSFKRMAARAFGHVRLVVRAAPFTDHIGRIVGVGT